MNNGHRPIPVISRIFLIPKDSREVKYLAMTVHALSVSEGQLEISNAKRFLPFSRQIYNETTNGCTIKYVNMNIYICTISRLLSVSSVTPDRDKLVNVEHVERNSIPSPHSGTPIMSMVVSVFLAFIVDIKTSNDCDSIL